MPCIGLSIDRRTAAHVREDYRDSKVRSLICICCAQIAVDTGHKDRSGIRYTSGEEQLFQEIASGGSNREGHTSLTLNFSEELYIGNATHHLGASWRRALCLRQATGSGAGDFGCTATPSWTLSAVRRTCIVCMRAFQLRLWSYARQILQSGSAFFSSVGGHLRVCMTVQSSALTVVFPCACVVRND